MSRLGKSFKNRFLRQALAVLLAGTMVMSGVPVSAAELTDTEVSEEAKAQSETALEETISEEIVSEKITSEEMAEDEEVQQSEASESTETEETEIEEKESEESTEEKSHTEETVETEESNASDDVKYITETLKFRAEGLSAGVLSNDLKVDDYFTVKAVSEIQANSATIDNISFGQRVKFSGGGSINERSIQIKALGSGTLTVYVASSSSGTARTIDLLDSTGSTKDSASGGATAEAITLQIPEKGIYYVRSHGSGLYVYGIDFEVTYKEGETFDEEPSETESESPTFTAPEGDSVYDAKDGYDQSKVMYNMEGYAASANVTGGGLLKEDSAGYHVASNEKEFLAALEEIRLTSSIPHVIEITAKELNLGNLELKKNYNLNITNSSGGDYSGVIRIDKPQPVMHPTLKETGVSTVKLNGFHNVTIFSKDGTTIKHAGIVLEDGCQNIILRNLTFDELWEWDEQDSGGYDTNDWDYISVEKRTDGIWIDHCTFYKSYDGIIDVKLGEKSQRVTISWCEFLPGSKDNNEFFNKQMTWLEENQDKTTYYKSLLNGGMSANDIWWYAYGQKKTHLFGYSDSDVTSAVIRATLANNYYKNSMDRMPRLRRGKVHEYNCILDAQDLYTKKKEIEKRGVTSHITSQGAISTCGGEMLLENCYFSGILHPLYSGNGSSPTGYINAIESVYYMDGERQAEVKLEKSGSGSGEALVTDAEKFKSALPYSDYITYNAEKLDETVAPHVGAGKLDMTTVQWETTKYGNRTGDEGSSTEPTEPAPPESTEPESTEASSTESSSVEASSTESSSVEASSAESSSVEASSTESSSTEASSTESSSVEASSTESSSTEASSTESSSAEVSSTESSSTEASSTESSSVEASSTEPSSTEPESTEASSTEPESTEPIDPDKPTVDINIADTNAITIRVPNVISNGKAGARQDSTPIVTWTHSENGRQIETKLVEDYHYTVEDQAGVNYTTTGEKSYVIKAVKGSGFTGERTVSYTVCEKKAVQVKQVSKLTVKLGTKSFNYTGAAITPEDITVLDGKTLLTKGVDYDIVYKNNYNAGTAYIIVVGRGTTNEATGVSYIGSKEVKFTIKKVNVKNLTITYDSRGYKYLGSAVQVSNLVVKLNENYTLKEGIDYTISYKTNTKPGTASFIIKAAGINFAGSVSNNKFTIDGLKLRDIPASALKTIEYSPKGAKLSTISFSTSDGQMVLKEGTDYKVKYYGKAKQVGDTVTVDITGKNIDKNEKLTGIRLTVVPADFSNVKITSESDLMIDVKKLNTKDKQIKVTDYAGAKLKPGVDYTLAWDSADKGNTATGLKLTVKPADTSLYTGEKTVNYRIATKLVAKNYSINNKYFNGKTPVTISAKDINGLEEGDYKIINYKNNAKSGKASVTIEGTGKYYGKITLRFNIYD